VIVNVAPVDAGVLELLADGVVAGGEFVVWSITVPA
jgi:hypothetical protein